MKKIYLLLFLLCIFTSCEKENIPVPKELNDSHSISSVSKDEVLKFLNSIHLNSTQKSSSTYNYDLDDVRYESIRNTNDSLAILPYDPGESDYFSRVLILKIKDELKAIVFHLKESPVENNSPSFTGLKRITDLEGNYISGYRAKNGVIVSKFIFRRYGSNNNKSSEADCQESYNKETDDFCNGVLEEVVLSVESSGSTGDNYIYIPYMYLSAPPIDGGDLEADWNYGGGGSGSSTNTTEEEEGPSCESFSFSNTTSNWQEWIHWTKLTPLLE